MIYNEQPNDFKKDMEVVACLIECDGKILLLNRCDHKPEGDKWGLPGGKIDKKDKSKEEAMIRELREETGISLNEKDINFHKTFFVTHLGFSFEYNYFNYKLSNIPDINISKNEHKAFTWVILKEALTMPLVMDEEYCLKDFYGIK